VTPTARTLLLLAGLLFALFLLAKTLRPQLLLNPAQREARQRLRALKQRAQDHALSTAERASALRDAASLALQELQRPGLAASLARRAERLHPEDGAALSLLTQALRKQARYGALERVLWKKLATPDASGAPGAQRARDELVRLYEGPLKRPEIAAAIRRWAQ